MLLRVTREVWGSFVDVQVATFWSLVEAFQVPDMQNFKHTAVCEMNVAFTLQNTIKMAYKPFLYM